MAEYATNYHDRAKAIIMVLLGYAKTIAGPRWHKPTELQIEHFTLELDHVLNWAIDGPRRLGMVRADVHYKGPLSERQMQEVEAVLGLHPTQEKQYNRDRGCSS